jgi:hypothetical protein
MVEREFSLDVVIRDTLAVYDELLPKARAQASGNVVELRRRIG